MPNERRKSIAGFRLYYQDEIKTMVRQMKIDGGTLEDCIAELRLLAEFVRSQADGLSDEWPSLLQGTVYESLMQGQDDTGAADAPEL